MNNSAADKVEDPSYLKKPIIGMRWVLVLMCNLMYTIAVMSSNSLAVTIVAMVNSTGSTITDNSTQNEVCRSIDNSEVDESNNLGEFNWSSSQQGLVLGAYFWGFFAGRFIGGRLGEIIGQSIICGIGMTAGAVIIALSPIAAEIDVYCFVAARFLLGMCHGPTLPAVYSLMSKWAPRSQLATMLTTINAGFTVGGTIGILTAGWIIDSLGWRWVFWLDASVTLVWVPFWFYYVRNDPGNHPFVTLYEAKILEENVFVVVKKSVPWKDILLSPYLYICMFGLFARVWSYSMQFTVGPSYFSQRIGLELSTASLISGIASLVCLPVMILYGRLSDFLITGKYIKRLKVRKMMHAIGTIGPSMAYIALALAGCSITWTIVFYETIGILASATACSIYLSVIDIAPNYTGTIMGLLGLGNIGGSLAPMITSYLVVTDNGWNKSFYLTAGLSIISCISYVLLMTDKTQKWNNYKGKREEDEGAKEENSSPSDISKNS